jgi:uncharacterized SAM-binding protein YcdF (DUF218 family)
MNHVVVSHLLEPFAWLCLLPILAAAYLRRKRPDLGRRFVLMAVASAALVIFCLPLVSWLALGTLEWIYPPLKQRPLEFDAIVVLASYVRPASASHPRPEPDASTVYRCLRAAELYHEGERCTVIVSGGHADFSESAPSFAETMRQLLVQFGVSPLDLVVEEHSRTTQENACESKKLLDKRKLHKIILVTSTDHLPRAVACFRKQGFDVIPCGCHYEATEPDSWILQLVPTPGAARINQAVCHEWIGMVWYWLNGWI